MKRERGEASSGGIGVLGLLGVVFVTLKLVGVEPVASWSWWWILAPFWGGFALAAVIVIGYLVVVAAQRIARHCRHGR